MIDNDYPPIWDGNYLIVLSATPILYIGGWQKELRVTYPDENSDFHKVHLYDYVGMSMRTGKNYHDATNSWAQTIPDEVRRLCGLYPSNQFYLARVAALDAQVIDLARRNFVVHVIWLEHCRRNRLSIEVMLKFIGLGECQILKELGVLRIDDALFVCKRVAGNVLSGIPPEFILNCLIDEFRLDLLATLRVIERRHFTLLSTHKGLAKKELLAMLGH